jgi:hypothetical protein
MTRRRSGFRILSCVLGTLLLVTAGLKFEALGVVPLSRDPLLSSPRMIVAAIEIEVILGIWLVSGYAQRMAWVGALIFFAGAGGVSLFAGTTGQRACPCFGRLGSTFAGSVWLATAIDLFAVAALLRFRPTLCGGNSVTPAWRERLSAGSLVAFALLAGLAVTINPPRALIKYRGDDVAIEPETISIGRGPSGETTDVDFRLVNLGDKPVSILGVSARCPCVRLDNLPLTVQPGQVRTVTARAAWTGGEGSFHRRFVLYTDSERQPTVVGRLVGYARDVDRN